MLIRIILLSILLSSCGIHRLEIRQGNLLSAEMISKVKIGMTKQQVNTALGTPLIEDPFHSNRWDYVYRFSQEGVLQDKKRLTLYFDGDKLQRIDDETYAASSSSDAAPVKSKD